jgi:hypothetical protein
MSYAGVDLAILSEIRKLGLDNSTQHDHPCLTGPAVQIIGETKCFGKGRGCINLIKGAKGPTERTLPARAGSILAILGEIVP